MPKTDTPGGRTAVNAARKYREDQNKRHRANLRKARANALFTWMARGTA